MTKFYDYLLYVEQDPLGGMGGPPPMAGGVPPMPMGGMGGPPPSLGPGLGGGMGPPMGSPGMGGPGMGQPPKPTKIKFDDVWDVIESLLKGKNPDKEAKKDLQNKENQVNSPEQPSQQPPQPPQQGMPPQGQAAPGLQHLQGLPGM